MKMGICTGPACETLSLFHKLLCSCSAVKCGFICYAHNSIGALKIMVLIYEIVNCWTFEHAEDDRAGYIVDSLVYV